jgi:hypothetical protein
MKADQAEMKVISQMDAYQVRMNSYREMMSIIKASLRETEARKELKPKLSLPWKKQMP